MFSPLTAFILVVHLKSALCINHSEFCVADPVCRGKYTSDGEYKTECTSVCNEKHTFKCSDTFCAASNQSCVLVPKRKTSLSSILMVMHFKVKIAKCQVKSYAWNPKDFCVNSFGCQEVQFIRLMGGYFFRKKTSCRCRGRLGYHCGDWACAVNSRACDASKLKYTSLKEATAFGNKEIKPCGNDSLVFRKQFSLF